MPVYFPLHEKMRALLPARRQTSRLLLLSGTGLRVYRWRKGGRFERQGHYPPDERGWRAFEEMLAEQQTDRSPLFVLVDVVEEELRRENVPPLFGKNRQQLLQRRLERLFPLTPYRRAVAQGRGRDKQEKILFSALINPDLISAWMSRLQRYQSPVCGVWSLQLLSRDLLRKITTGSDDALLVTIHCDGLRQTYFRRGRTMISRKISLPSGAADAQVAYIFQEVSRTRRYLLSLRLLAPTQTLDLFFVTPDPLKSALPTAGERFDGVNLAVIDASWLQKELGITYQESESGSELLYSQLLLSRPPSNHYGCPEELQFYSNNPIARLVQRLQSVQTPSLETPDQEKIEVKSTRRLGDVLIEKKILTQDQLQAALTEQRVSRTTLGKVLIDLGMVSEEVIRETLADVLHQETVDLSEVLPQPEALSLVSKLFAQQHHILPLLLDEKDALLTVAMSNPMNVTALDMLSVKLQPGIQIKPLLAGDRAIMAAIDRLYDDTLSVEGVLRELETGEMEQKILASVSDATFHHPMIRLVNALLHDAVKQGASDIHIGPIAGFVRVRYRIDGILHGIYTFHRKLLSSLVVRIKVMGDLNIAETRLPQNGQVSFPYLEQIVNFRISIQPTVNGENIVLRVLDTSQEIRPLDRLGVSSPNLQAMHTLLRRPGGLVVVTGPTGSGKTTTLYSMLNHLNDEGTNIMTMEDPVEYPVPSILQTAVNQEAGLDYATGIQSLLWQDPDILLVGEVHDQETANMALQAAMTGHMVFTTLHANSTLGALPRLMNLGVSSDYIAGNINSILSQRLVRRLCGVCREKQKIEAFEARLLGVGREEVGELYHAKGCAACRGTGYKGRFPLMEVLLVDEDFDDLVSRGATLTEFRALAQDKPGFRTMVEDGFEWIRCGETSLAEVSRVLDVSVRLGGKG